MKRYLISAALILCSNALAMKPATQNNTAIGSAGSPETMCDLRKRLAKKQKPLPSMTSNDINHAINDVITPEQLIEIHNQTHRNNQRCSIKGLLYGARECITNESPLFKHHSRAEISVYIPSFQPSKL